MRKHAIVIIGLVLSAPARAEDATGTGTVAVDEDEDRILVIDPYGESPAPLEGGGEALGGEEEAEAGHLRARAAARFDASLIVDASFDRTGEQVAELSLGGRLELDVDITSQLAAFAAPSFQYVTALDREGGDRQIVYLVPPEAYVTWAEGSSILRVGSLIFNWGVSDIVAPNDVLNPYDLRRAVPGFSEVLKIPVLAAELLVGLGPVRFRAVVEPFFSSSRFHLVGWDFAVLQPGGSVGAPGLPLESIIEAPTLDLVGDLAVATERPADRPDNATVGLRGTLGLGDLDLSVSFVHGWDTLPAVTADPDLVLLAGAFAEASAGGRSPPFDDPEVVGALVRVQTALEEGRTLFRGSYRRRTVVGSDASIALDPFVFKLDVAYTFDRTLYTSEFRPEAHPWLNTVIGAEYYYGDQLQVIVELFNVAIFDVPARYRLVYFEEIVGDAEEGRTVLVPGGATAIRYGVLEGDLRFELSFGGTFTRGDLLVSPAIRWKLDDHHQLSIGGVVVEGRKDGYGGAYTHTDHVFVSYAFSR